MAAQVPDQRYQEFVSDIIRQFDGKITILRDTLAKEPDPQRKETLQRTIDALDGLKNLTMRFCPVADQSIPFK